MSTAEAVLRESIQEWAVGQGWESSHPVVMAAVAEAVTSYARGASVSEACDLVFGRLRSGLGVPQSV